ncbi:chemotaxis sensory histidine protein kinase, CheA [Isoalcanivorax pacificus W11-5]|uniref:Chemotaxis protein CheA n=1 Tax=Isoalcanivorax pacificus W11-5 TaxID=391936 RepID=A0A0B4XQ38_9GAMM|nr:chemotaxis protein CheA [Isoalcanivorax pacificus]AJD49336.1 chemotaxis sensory histidine protein kinase, CheA [Isoalcanivorax pacificus W11-5]
MDISEFHDSFFEEAEELLREMEACLLALDVTAPDTELLNAIFRAAHSIKGGAGAFGFQALQQTTHLLENLLDHARRGELTLRRDIVDLFLDTKDMLNDQMAAYRQGNEPDPEALQRICETLLQLALEEVHDGGQAPPPPPAPVAAAAVAADEPAAVHDALRITFLGVGEADRTLLVAELGQLGNVLASDGDDVRYSVTLATSVAPADIEAVLCFIVEPEQLEIELSAAPSEEEAAPPADSREATPVPDPVQTPAPHRAEGPAQSAVQNTAQGAAAPGTQNSESSSIRVPVTKVDQIINLVGELIITQSMLNQVSGQLDGFAHGALVNGLNQLQRNARALQESVMSVRMVPMDYVFSRFPRLVRDLAGKLDKDVVLVTEGKSTELDKSLTERIVDPLTHLVRNSLDHGIESPDVREAAGKPRQGTLSLSARHQGGNILIEVADDGGGLNREKILARARDNGLSVSDAMSDADVWQLIFAPGFSTAEQVSDVSGRGVGMDVVKRNIQGMGGHVEILSQPGQGTTTRIVLPLTLAILDGMSVRVGEETFILPVSVVTESMQPRAEQLYRMAGDDLLLKVREDYLPVVALRDVMDVPGARVQATGCIAVIVHGEGRRYALLVDDLIGQQQVVVKNLETNYRKVPGISAATILGDGRVALILDIADLYRLNQSKGERRAPTTPLTPPSREPVEELESS